MQSQVEELFLKKYGNKITASESWVIRFAEECVKQSKETVLVEVNERWFLDNGFTRRAGVAISYTKEISRNDFGFKELSFMYNNDTHENQWYAMFAERKLKNLHEADVCCLRKDIKYTSQINLLLQALIKHG